MTFKKNLFKQPSAWIPISLSLIVLTIMLIHIGMFGAPSREIDEGTAAHLFQLWLVLEVIMVAFFAFKWLPKRLKESLVVLALQIIAVIAACAPVFILQL